MLDDSGSSGCLLVLVRVVVSMAGTTGCAIFRALTAAATRPSADEEAMALRCREQNVAPSIVLCMLPGVSVCERERERQSVT